MVKMLQKTLGAEEPGGGVGWDFLWHMERRPLAPRHPHGHVRRAQGRPTASPSTADRVPRRRQGAESSPKSHLANKGAPDKHSNFSCRRQAVTKENTTDTRESWPGGGPVSHSPSPHRHPPPSSQHQDEGVEWEDPRKEIRGKRIEVGGQALQNQQGGGGGCSP